ncbi:hypothetical protein D3C72_2062300 [compost metagenome]
MTDCTKEFSTNFNKQFFNWLFDNTVFFNRYSLRATNFKFEVFTAKCFNKYRKV